MKNQENQSQKDERTQQAGSRNTELDQNQKNDTTTRRTQDLDQDLNEDLDSENENRSGKPSQQSPGRNR